MPPGGWCRCRPRVHPLRTVIPPQVSGTRYERSGPELSAPEACRARSPAGCAAALATAARACRSHRVVRYRARAAVSPTVRVRRCAGLRLCARLRPSTPLGSKKNSCKDGDGQHAAGARRDSSAQRSAHATARMAHGLARVAALHPHLERSAVVSARGEWQQRIRDDSRARECGCAYAPVASARRDRALPPRSRVRRTWARAATVGG